MARLYANFPEAQNEIKRDLAELGITVHTETMQDKNIEGDEDFATKELQNYLYTVTRPNYDEVEGVHEEWVKQEWEDRLVGNLNPGRSYRKRKGLWEQFLEQDLGHSGSKLPRKFSYTYSERMGGGHIDAIITELLTHPNSRQLYLPVWDRRTDEKRLGERRVPCSLGYWFVRRGGALHETYMMRSCDFMTHYGNDVALAAMLLHYICAMTENKVGTFTHFVGSLHMYRKDAEGVF